jgi:uncharacterized protein (TIGR00369 family)
MKNNDHAFLVRAVADKSTEIPFDTSPILKALNCELIEAEPQRVKLRFHPTETYLQGAGVVNGGITATMLDLAMAFASLTTCEIGDHVASISFNVNFLGPVFAGPVIVEARLAAAGFRTQHAEASLSDVDGKLLATASSPISVKRLKK